jgi:hypothetical protein
MTIAERALVRQPGSGLKPKFSHEIESSRYRHGPFASYRNEPFGMFLPVTPDNARLKVIVGDGMGWDHVSVSCEDRCPTWDEMNWVKDQFFDPECCVLQFHPPKSQYVNNHIYVLHLWHAQGSSPELPPRDCV